LKIGQYLVKLWTRVWCLVVLILSVVTLDAIAPFLRYGDLLVENCEFFLPHSHSTPSLEVNPFEFLDELFITKTIVLGLSVGEDFATLSCIV